MTIIHWLLCMDGSELDCADFDFDRDGRITTIDECRFFYCANGIVPAPPAYCIACSAAADCADMEAPIGIRDDACAWWDCVGGECLRADTMQPSDMGETPGVCPPDGFCNNGDVNLALACFGSTTSCNSINIDAGSAFGNCALDGFCNVFDANHALSCFQNINLCTCGESLMGFSEPDIVATTGLKLVRAASATESDTVTVRVFLEGAVASLQSYQLELAASGGTSGSLELIGIEIEERSDYVFGKREDNFSAFNVGNGQMLSGIASAGIAADADAYLATFTYRSSSSAEGFFVVDAAFDEFTGNQTFFVSAFVDKIEVSNSTPAVVATSGGLAESTSE